MQNSLDRLLAGIAASLTDDVASEVSDPWVRSQVTAAAELLTQLSRRVTWDVDAFMPWIPACRDVLERAIEHDGSPEAHAAGRAALALGPLDELGSSAPVVEAYLEAHLEALSEVAAWSIAADLSDGLRSEIRDVVDAHAATDRALLRSSPATQAA